MNELRQSLRLICDGNMSYREMANQLGKSKCYIQELVREMGLPRPKRDLSNKRKRSPESLALIDRIKSMCDGKTSSLEISIALNCQQKYVQRIMLEFDLPRLPPVSPTGSRNTSWKGGRRIDLDGYVSVSAPNHPFAKVLPGKKIGKMLEHRLVAEQKLGRYLLPSEVVDHIDGITIHNHPDNLRVFASNACHLKATISEKVPNWSEAGLNQLDATRRLGAIGKQVDTYAEERKQGVVRLRQILRAWLSLEPDSPYLLGTLHWLEKAGISDLSRSNLQLHLDKLNQR